MKKDKKKQEKVLNLVGIACGVFVLLVGIITGVLKAMPATAGVKDSEIPASAPPEPSPSPAPPPAATAT